MGVYRRFFVALLALGFAAAGLPASSGAEVRKVVASGDVLPDGTALTVVQGHVSINAPGQVAFVCLLSEPFVRFLICTQDGLVVDGGDVLPDGTTVVVYLANFFNINARGDIAFIGRTINDATAVFTQNGLVAKVGDVLPDGTTLEGIGDRGAINDGGKVAFFGKTGGMDAVFTQDGLVAKPGDVLPDGTTFEFIVNRAIAINDPGQVAFIGLTETEPVVLAAVFTQNGLVAKVGDVLPDGTQLDGISLGFDVVDINAQGQIAFIGQTGGMNAVFTQDGLVAKVGDVLPDGTTLTGIYDNRAIAINAPGHIAFIGQTAGMDAVFTQDGLVAKVGDVLPDGTTLTAIVNRGVDINAKGQVVFSGAIDGATAILTGP